MFDAHELQNRQSKELELNAIIKPGLRCSAAPDGLVYLDPQKTGLLANKGDVRDTTSEDAIRDEVSRILKSSMFIQSDRLGRFLRFTVERTLAGEGDLLKEYLIGTEVYDRPSSYRPSEDSIVRTEARRLRSRLKEYYESVGGNDLVLINYRPGSYRPSFQNQPKQGLKIVARTGTGREDLIGRDAIRIAVLPFSGAGGSAPSGVYAQLITDELIHELVRMDGVRVTAASSVTPLLAKAKDVRSLARKLDVEVVFEGTVCQDNSLLHITSRVVNAADGFQIWSERVETEQNMHSLFKICEIIATSLVSRVRPATA